MPSVIMIILPPPDFYPARRRAYQCH